MKTQNYPRRASGFTLIELMVSITIIILLAGLVVGGMSFVEQKRSQAKAEVQIKLLEKGIEEYKFDNGAFPTVPNANITNATQARANNNAIYQRLYLDGVTNPGTRIYLAELDPKAQGQGWIINIGGTNYITDPWGREYRFRPGNLATGELNPAAMGPGFDIWSMGKDGLTQPGTESQPYDINHAQNRDDIRNF